MTMPDSVSGVAGKPRDVKAEVKKATRKAAAKKTDDAAKKTKKPAAKKAADKAE